MQFEVLCYISMWNIKSLWSFFLAIFVISGIVSSSLWSESDSILAKQLVKVPDKMSLTFVKTTWRPESPWYSDIFRIPLALSPGGWLPRVTWVHSVHVTQHDRDPELTLTCAGECWLEARSRTRSRWSGSAWRCRSQRCPGPASRRRARGPGRWRRRAESPGWGRSLPRNLEHEALHTSLSLVTCTLLFINSFTTFFKHQNLMFPKLT